MKKIFQYSFAALVGLVLASCTGDYTDWASPQMNPAENAAEKYGVTIVAGADANIVMPVRNDNVKLVALNAASDKVADFAVTSLTVNGEAIDASVENGSIVVSAAKLNELVQNQFNSRASVARTLLPNPHRLSMIRATISSVTSKVMAGILQRPSGWKKSVTVFILLLLRCQVTEMLGTSSMRVHIMRTVIGTRLIKARWVAP